MVTDKVLAGVGSLAKKAFGVGNPQKLYCLPPCSKSHPQKLKCVSPHQMQSVCTAGPPPPLLRGLRAGAELGWPSLIVP